MIEEWFGLGVVPTALGSCEIFITKAEGAPSSIQEDISPRDEATEEVELGEVKCVVSFLVRRTKKIVGALEAVIRSV